MYRESDSLSRSNLISVMIQIINTVEVSYSYIHAADHQLNRTP
jgi:hypothetical protein